MFLWIRSYPPNLLQPPRIVEVIKLRLRVMSVYAVGSPTKYQGEGEGGHKLS